MRTSRSPSMMAVAVLLVAQRRMALRSKICCSYERIVRVDEAALVAAIVVRRNW